MTFIQFQIFVYIFFNLLKYSLVINTLIPVNRAVLLEIITPALIKPNVELLIVEADPIIISVIINKTFFLFKFLYFFL